MIYIVEDDASIRELVVYTLTNTGYPAMGFATPQQFWNQLQVSLPDLIILDIMLPQENGLSILRKLREGKENQALPIILLTAKSAEYDKVEGLDTGADDYITKPFGMMELISRIKALLRRTQHKTEAHPVLTYREITLDISTRVVTVAGFPITVTLKEFDLLHLFLQHPNQVFLREDLLQQIWGYTFEGESRTLDVHIRTLRQKLGEYGHYIETLRGVGYKLGGERP